MLKIEMRDGQCRIEAAGTPLETTAEMAEAIGTLYSNYKSSNPAVAELFKIALLRFLEDDSPAWRDKDGMVGVCIHYDDLREPGKE